MARASTYLATLAATDTPQRIDSTSGNRFYGATLLGIKGFDGQGKPLANTASVWVGLKSNELPFEILAGGSLPFVVPAGSVEDLYNLYMMGAQNDGLYVILY